ncbi:hypothetical protein DFH11DRAFT_1823648 [Phellopilus nigrolimitatus]|nr:hypothetical protein DFH11DRAFT_1823648 [Phellopilus nigrolimitatus]
MEQQHNSVTALMEAISGMSGEEFIFHKVHDNVYVRKCYGIEALTTLILEACNGVTMLTASAAILLDSSPSREILELQVREAWQLLRHLVPGIACQTLKLPSARPTSLEDVGTWADQTTFFDDSVVPFYEKHEQIRNNRWWNCVEPHYNAELHVSPLETSSSWQFSLTAPHNSIDGRGGFALLELFFEFLTSVIEKRAQPTSEIKWGEEVSRLPPPGPLATSFAKTGLPLESPKTPAPTSAEVENQAAPAMVPWIIPAVTIRDDVQGDIGRVVKFSPETTAKIHAACKEHGRTITQIVSALVILANTEAALKLAGQTGEEHYKHVSDGFSNSTHYLIAMNSISQRHKLPGGYDSFISPTSSPLCAVDSLPLFFPMDAIRKLVKPEATKRTALREVDHDQFWNGLVNDMAAVWKAIDVSLEAYFTRQAAMHDHRRSHNLLRWRPWPAQHLNAYLPSATRKTLTVEDVVASTRNNIPLFMTLFYQYNDQLSLNFSVGEKFATAESLRLVADIFEEWTMAVI